MPDLRREQLVPKRHCEEFKGRIAVSSYFTKVYSDRYDSGDYYSRGYRDGGGYYDGGVYHSGGYYEPQYHYRRQAERSGTVAVTERHDTVRASKSVSHGAVSHQASATVSHGHNGNKATVGSSTKPAKVPSAGKHPRS